VLAGDASFRRYDRLTRGSRAAVLMDAPPPHEDVRPFVHVGRFLRRLGLAAPQILAADDAAGLLLLEDLGDDLFSRVVREGRADEGELYAE
jgi:aminoglycoside/choline kinase family phosphotransferase